jgi:hypothetical protein
MLNTMDAWVGWNSAISSATLEDLEDYLRTIAAVDAAFNVRHVVPLSPQ